MLDSQMSTHFETHSNMNFTNCCICYLQVFNLEQHISTSHPKGCSCKMHFIDLQQLRLHEPNCNQLKIEADHLSGESTNLEKQVTNLNHFFTGGLNVFQLDISYMKCIGSLKSYSNVSKFTINTSKKYLN